MTKPHRHSILGDVRLVTIAQNVPGPLAVARLVAGGAVATKVEPPTGDPMQALSPSWYEEMHRQVWVERLDLKSEHGRARLLALLAEADVFITSHRPSALARLGLDPESLRRDAPRVRTLRIVGSTAQPEVAGHDLTYQAEAGLVADELPRTLIADVMASERAYSGVLTLLREPPGTLLDVGILESMDSIVAPLRHGVTASGGLLGGGLARYGVFRSKDGYVAVAALEPHFEQRLYAELGLPRGADIREAFVGRTGAEWEHWARERDLPILAVRDSAGTNGLSAPPNAR